MKGTTVLLGSPRHLGNSEMLSEALLEALGSEAGEIARFRLANMAVSGCLDCRGCWKDGKPCVIGDSMVEIYEALRKSDLVVFVTPLYWYTWSGQIKPVLDRFLPFVSPQAPFHLKGKKAILLATAGAEDPSCFEGLRFSFRTSCGLLGLEPKAEILAHGIYKRGDIEGTHWLELAKETGKRLS